MTNSPAIGNALSLKCKGQHRHIELTGGGRTRRSEIYPDHLCYAILEGLVNQMQEDKRIGCSFKSDEVEFDNSQYQDFIQDNQFEINMVTTDVIDGNTILTWSRSDYGTSRLMLPGANGPL